MAALSEAPDAVKAVPAPWRLEGDGLILVYRCGEDFAREHGFATPEMGRFRGGLGALTLVDYKTSGVGPYRELLFAPGRFELAGKRGHSISKIYVSTEASVVSGRENWGIPKELADFHRTQVSEAQGWQVMADGREILRVSYTPGRVAFRVWTWPLSVPILQKLANQIFLTRLTAHGVCTLATIHELAIDPAYFPDVSRIEPLGAVRVSRFRMTFPIARMQAV